MPSGLTTSTGFNGKAHPSNATDAGCTNAGCHGVENGVNKIDLAHIPVTPPNSSNALHLEAAMPTRTQPGSPPAPASSLPTGAIKVTYDVAVVGRNANRIPT